MAKILIVDDSPDEAEMLVVFLKLAGHHAIAAESGADGLDTLRTEQFDVVISDIRMPFMDGYQFARAMRRLPAYTRTPLVAISAYERDLNREGQLHVGFDARLSKPIDAVKFVDLVERLVSHGDSVRPLNGEKSANPPFAEIG
jgi:CheY-like chemotaxis protein